MRSSDDGADDMKLLPRGMNHKSNLIGNQRFRFHAPRFKMALRDIIALMSHRSGISRQDAYMLCSLADDLRVTQTVNREKTDMMTAKTLVDER